MRSESLELSEDAVTGTIISSYRRSSLVQTPEFTSDCRFSPNLSFGKDLDPVVGDRCKLQKEKLSGEYYITEILPRENYFYRPAPEDREMHDLILAANIDQVVLLVSIARPDFNMAWVDRYLILAEMQGFPILLAVNKTDLVDELPPEVESYRPLVHGFFPISVHAQTGLNELMEALKGRCSLLSGPSGSGKSSLIREWIPQSDPRIGGVRRRDGKGKHTTTHSRIYNLSESGILIDTPGIKTLGLWKLRRRELSQYFPGFREIEHQCYFRDCLHENEPDCAVKNALDSGELPADRYESYLRILNSLRD